jgi:hypothetical protein
MKTIKEQNKLIAEFMGFTNEKNLGWYDNDMLLSQIVYDLNDGNCFDELLFDKSWDWLMPVVEKINSIVIDEVGTRVTMRSNATLIERVGEERWEAGPIITGEGMLINTYKAVIEFIKWYNETK